jgi:hypothetical protein
MVECRDCENCHSLGLKGKYVGDICEFVTWPIKNGKCNYYRRRRSARIGFDINIEKDGGHIETV